MRQRDISQRSHSGAKANDENGKSTQFNTDRRREREREQVSSTHTVSSVATFTYLYYILVNLTEGEREKHLFDSKTTVKRKKQVTLFTS